MGEPRAENRADVTIAGVAYQVVPGPGHFIKGTIRSLIQEQDIGSGGATSRSDMRAVFQADWAGGSRWERPLLSEQNLDSYFTSDGFDVTRTPGNVVALPDTTSIATSIINVNPVALARKPNLVYYFEPTGAGVGLMAWDGSTFAALTNDFNTAGQPIDMCWDPALATVFALFANGDVRYITPDSAGGNVINIGVLHPAGNIFYHNGRLMVWNGNTLQEITDPLGTPALVTVFNDGMGADYTDPMDSNVTDPLSERLWGRRLAFASAEGIYLVKNVIQDGLPTPFIYRVDRDNAGTDIGTPVATLPVGTIALDIYVHLGALIIACTTDIWRFMKNDISNNGNMQTVFYHWANNSLGTIGSPLGPNPDESVYRFLGSDVGHLYIGGTQRVWVYDAIRGGLHPLFDDQASMANGVWSSMINTDLSGQEVLQFFHDGGAGRRLAISKDEAGNVMTHQLDSNYFDGGLPAEQKSIVSVTLMTDGLVANETWTVTFSADDAAFGSAITFDTDDAKTTKQNLGTPLVGHRFQYRLAYTASADVSTPSVVKGIVVWMVQGEFLQQWRIKLRMMDSANIGNKVVRADTQQTNLEALSTNQAIVTFIDAYRKTAATTQVRVQTAVIDKSSTNEGEVDVVLVEHSTT